MNEPTPGRRRFGRLLIGAAALALPLTATITYAASEPAPPAAAPQHRKLSKVVVIDNPAGSTIDEKNLHTHVVTRDGKTIVYKTPKPLSDAELAERIDRIDWAQPAPPAPPEAPAAPGSAHTRKIHTTVIHTGHDGEQGECDGGAGDVDVESDAAARHHVVKVRICRAVAIAHAEASEAVREAHVEAEKAHREARAEALEGLREARAEVAADPEIPSEVRGEVLKELDGEIERLAKEG